MSRKDEVLKTRNPIRIPKLTVTHCEECVYTFVSDTITLSVTYEMEAELKRLPRYRKYNPKLVDMLIAQLRLRLDRIRLDRIVSTSALSTSLCVPSTEIRKTDNITNNNDNR